MKISEPTRGRAPAKTWRLLSRDRARAWLCVGVGMFGMAGTTTAQTTAPQTPGRIARIGFLSITPASPGAGPAQAVAKALTELGHIDGRTAAFEFRDADWRTEQLPALARELVERRVDVIVAFTNLPGFAARQATRQVPIVVWGIHGALETGLVPDLAKPGGNVTGIESLAPELDAKRVALLKEMYPGLARLGVVYNAEDPGAPFHLASAGDAARKLGVTLVPLAAKRPGDFDAVLSDAAGARVDGLLVFADRLTSLHWERIAAFAARHRLPTACEFRFLVQAGCLISYGPSPAEFTARVAQQVDKIVRGARPADLPVERTTRFEMVLNMKTARTLAIGVPAAVRIAADDVVE